MIGVVLALALQAIGADAAAAASPGGDAGAQAKPAPANAADAIADILANTPPDTASPPAALPAGPPPPPPAPPGPTAQERAQMYESGVRSSFQARESRQGPLDGRWALTDAEGKSLYMLQFADPGEGRGPVEGAWRNLGRQGAVGASGFLTSANHYGQNLTVTFEEGGSCVLTLILGADGRWTGNLLSAGVSRPVVMTRS